MSLLRCGWLRPLVVCFMVVWGELEDDMVIRATQMYSVLHRTTKDYSETLHYIVPLQCYSVLQSTTPVLQGTLQYYSVLQSTTPALLCSRIDHEMNFCGRRSIWFSVKFGMIARARTVIFFNTKCSWWARKVTLVER